MRALWSGPKLSLGKLGQMKILPFFLFLFLLSFLLLSFFSFPLFFLPPFFPPSLPPFLSSFLPFFPPALLSELKHHLLQPTSHLGCALSAAWTTSILALLPDYYSTDPTAPGGHKLIGTQRLEMTTQWRLECR